MPGPSLFDTAAYADSLGMGGSFAVGSPVPLINRAIPMAGRRDGVLPWPHVYAPPGALEALPCALPDLVSIVGVLNPAMTDDEVADIRRRGIDLVMLKEHFVYDPCLPDRPLSASTRTKIRRAQDRWYARDLDASHLSEVLRIYREVVARKGLGGTFWDFSPVHFDLLLRSRESRVMGVIDADGRVGGFICAVPVGTDLHAIHLAGSESAQQSWAMYALMAQVVGHCRDSGSRLFVGGPPRGSQPGAVQFKSRWCNTTRPAALVRIVIDEAAYEALPQRAPSGYFPRYREPW